MSIDLEKKAAGYAAAEQIQEGQVVGIGTGSTVFYFIERLVERCKEGLKIQAASSSIDSAKKAEQGGIPLVQIDSINHLDITVDGADEVDEHWNMIKGGGGALFREKVLATSSREMIVIVDSSKYVPCIGHKKLPLELLPFGKNLCERKLHQYGYQGTFRDFVTDNGLCIYDLEINENIHSAKILHETLINITGVCETGLFYDVATQIIIGNPDGTTKVINERKNSSS